MFKNSTKIAIVHDWLDVYAGAEKVLECLLSMFPNADLFCIVDYMPADKRGFLAKKRSLLHSYKNSHFQSYIIGNYCL